MMTPLDVANVFARSLDLQPRHAALLTVRLIKHIHLSELFSPAGETNAQYPVPNKHTTTDFEESVFGPELNMNELPPGPRSNAGDWPYDPNTVAIMDPKSKSQKRPLMQGAFSYEPSKTNNVGGSGNATFSKNGPHNADGFSSVSSNSYTKQGIPGWSSSPADKEYDLPE